MHDVFERLSEAIADQYTLERELGAGGMAVVFLARDIKHSRPVAVKVLRPELAAAIGSERFLLEIEIAARLTHPNILPLHDSGEADSLLYYVMPYVEGEALHARLFRERQLPVDEAVRITAEVASALDYAHRQDVIHRDIKPENILLHDGRALVADFGIARAALAAGQDRLTQTGLSLGTPQYMSPEQASGDPQVDRRTDIYSLATVLYEMLAGHTPHTGPNNQAIIAKTLTEEPTPVTVHRPSVPPHVDIALRKGLAKLAADRFATAAEFGDAVAGRTAVTAEHLAFSAEYPMPVASQPPTTRKRILPWVLFAAGVIYAGIATALNLTSRVAERAVTRLTIILPDTAPIADVLPSGGISNALALSPDGMEVVYVADLGDRRMLYLRDLRAFHANPVAGTEGAAAPFFSPDGEWLTFFADGELKRVSRRGGAPISITPTGPGSAGGGIWMNDEEILYSTYGGNSYIAPSRSGPSRISLETPVFGPQRLPQPGRFLGYRESTVGAMGVYTNTPGNVVTDTLALFEEDGGTPNYLAPHHLVFVLNGTIYGAQFDPDGLAITGTPTPLVVGVVTGAFQGGQYAVSRNGTLAYQPGQGDDFLEFVWVDPQTGETTPLPLPPDSYRNEFSVSPDGRRLAATLLTSRYQVRVYDLAGGPPIRLAALGSRPQWSPDGNWIAYTNVYSRPTLTMRRRADAVGPTDTIATGLSFVESWVTGDLLGVRRQGEGSGTVGVVDIGVLRLGEPEPDWVVATPDNEWGIELSPDGRHFAYINNSEGVDHAYIQTYPPSGPPVRVTRETSIHPRWTRDGRNLIYQSEDRYYSVPVHKEGGLSLGDPVFLFEGDYENVNGRPWDVAPDGRILLLRRPKPPPRNVIQIVLNWDVEVDSLIGEASARR